MDISRLIFVLLVGCSSVSWAAESGDIMLEVQQSPREVRQTSDEVPQTPPEYLSLLQQIHGHPGNQASSQVRQVLITRRSPQDPSVSRYASEQQLYQPSSTYDIHQARLRASLAGQAPIVQTFGGTDESLQRQAALNAQEAAKNFRSSYRQRQPVQVAQQQQVQVAQIQRQPTQIRQLQPTYAPEAEAPQQFHVETSTQTQQPSIQNYYNAAGLDATSQANLQAYQQQASQAQQAAISFQQALQQSPRSGARPRLSQPQYILEQQHSYVVPDTTVAPHGDNSQQFNLAALQQAYQQIESANQKAVEQIQRQPQRQRTRYQQPIQQEDAASIGAGDGFEFVKQGVARQQILTPTVQPLKFEPETVYEPATSTAKPAIRSRQRQRVQTPPTVQSKTEFEAQYVAAEPPVQQYRRPVEQPQYVAAEPPVQQYRRPVEQPQYVAAEPPVQQYRRPVEQPQYARVIEQQAAVPQYTRVAAEQPTIQQYTRPVEQPQYVRVAAEQPAVQQYTRPAAAQQPELTRIQQLAAQQYRVVEQATQAVQYATRPTEQPKAVAVQYTRPTEQPRTAVVPQYTRPVTTAVPEVKTPTKIGNIDINLLRSLYTAAETLAKNQKDEVSPVTEDDFIKALLAQGRREQQAAEIIQSAAKTAPPAPTDKEIDVVHIPQPKNQRPITVDELDALIKAGYDVRPVGAAKVVSDAADPIRQQYLRQADFLEKQAALRSIRQRGAVSPSSRHTRSEQETQHEAEN